MIIALLPVAVSAQTVTLPGGVTVSLETLCAPDKRHTFRQFTDGTNVAKRVVARNDGEVKVENVSVAGVTCPVIKTAGMTWRGGGSSGNFQGESLEASRARSGETNPGETTSGDPGTTGGGENTGISAISG